MAGDTSQGSQIDPDLLDKAPQGAMCLGCRYDISGMDIRAKCPECGDRIAPSVNFISIEHAPPSFLAAVDKGTRGLTKAGALALAGLALLSIGYTLISTTLAGRAPLFCTIFGSALLLIATGVAAQHMWALSSQRLPGEDARAKMLRTVIRIMACIAVATAAMSAIIFALVGTDQFTWSSRSPLDHIFILWLAFIFLPVYTVFYLQSLAQRSRTLSSRLLMGLAVGTMAPLVTLPATLSFSSDGVFRLFGLPATSQFPTPNLLPIDPPYGWPITMGLSIAVALFAIAYFRKGMGFTPTAADQPHEPHRS
ncbi:MAG: hypothetical protein NCW75_14385 [Phycisphaera sp.]|nr:MAG: hypothetical protein NCW75_14385 [Phycisphaera sp.]